MNSLAGKRDDTFVEIIALVWLKLKYLLFCDPFLSHSTCIVVYLSRNGVFTRRIFSFNWNNDQER